MGVHELWSILEPVRQSVPLYSLSGKTLAVDLSLWVCEAQHVQGMMGRVTKPHLRNLFFRVSSLTLMGVKLVFVIEGDAPKIKTETISKRIEVRYGSNKAKSAPKTAKNPSRGRFKAVLRECAELLDCLGVPWVTAAGEAEAMCAFMDSQGTVDGCITNDGDAFLYGARTVYRNFNINSKDPQVDSYQMSRVQDELALSRDTLVGLALLLGCDYIPKGVAGVGKEQALKLIHSLRGTTLLQKFREWSSVPAESPDGLLKKVSHCLRPKVKMSMRRRMKASEREKLRMRSLAEALHQLRDYLPAGYSKQGQPLTKIQTLKSTIQYIKELASLLEHE
ncbi:hypothetical protein DNTS_031726 [Danionella cerebrum]|uniref:Flap endonuclease GEN homolog 1 n=1 Tax=Danionella cerebrum TaxID=2873325 RepID=A0A553QB90_9TELE|nr:hypothetical protein DNTS_031726 [Danionella translucida]